MCRSLIRQNSHCFFALSLMGGLVLAQAKSTSETMKATAAAAASADLLDTSDRRAVGCSAGYRSGMLQAVRGLAPPLQIGLC